MTCDAPGTERLPKCTCVCTRDRDNGFATGMKNLLIRDRYKIETVSPWRGGGGDHGSWYAVRENFRNAHNRRYGSGVTITNNVRHDNTTIIVPFTRSKKKLKRKREKKTSRGNTRGRATNVCDGLRARRVADELERGKDV